MSSHAARLNTSRKNNASEVYVMLDLGPYCVLPDACYCGRACGGGATSDDMEPERCSRPASESSELIFISVAAYRDPEAKWTLQDLFSKVQNPSCRYKSLDSSRSRKQLPSSWPFFELQRRDVFVQASMCVQARHPERLRVGVVWQIDAIQDQDFVRMAGDERWLKHVGGDPPR